MAAPIDVSRSGHYVGDCRDLLKRLPDACVQTCVTSPPYWGLRDYGVDGQFGLEQSPHEYVANMVDVFREIRRALKADGTLWINIGDTYRSKSLVGVPWMLAFGLREDGWLLRSDVIWHKPNPMPDGAKDRPTLSHEYVFLFAASDRYFFDCNAIAEKAGGGWNLRSKKGNTDRNDSTNDERGRVGAELEKETRNKRTVWTVASQPFSGSHFATMPPALVEPCVLAGSKPGDVVLDPFFGSGTTGQVAEKHGRRWIGFDINPAYEQLQKERTAQRSLALGGVK